MLAKFFSEISDKLIATAATILLVLIPPARKWLNRWPVESAVIISALLTLTIVYLTVNRLSDWPGDAETFQYGDVAGWGPTHPEPFTSTCPEGSYAVGVKWWGLDNGRQDCDRCTSKMQVICKPLSTLPKLSVVQ